MLWEALVQQAHDSDETGAADTLLEAASRIWQLTAEHALALTEAYRAATADLLLAQQRRRPALVEALLTGYPTGELRPAEAAAYLGLPPGSELMVVVAQTRGVAEEGLPGIERQLGDAGIAPAGDSPLSCRWVSSLPGRISGTLIEVLTRVARTGWGSARPTGR